MALTRWGRFVKAWERRLGDERRSGLQVPNEEAFAMRSAYQAWRQDERATGIPAVAWLEQQAGQFERQGFRQPARGDETKVTSNWQYDIWAFDAAGEWSTLGSQYAAVRFFQYEVGGPMGSGWGYTHAESCMHAHDSKEQAFPCLQRFQARGGIPSLDDLRPKKPILTANGVYRTADSEERFEGEIEAWDYGLTVPRGEGRRVLFNWEELQTVREEAGVNSMILKTESHSEIELVNLSEQEEAAWMHQLRDRGIAG